MTPRQLSMLMNVNFIDTDDKWKWEFELDVLFSVHSTWKRIVNIVTRWCRNVPIKVNIMMWRLMWDRLPTRINLTDKDIDIPSVLFPICNNELESSDHVFFKANERPPMLEKGNYIPWESRFRRFLDNKLEDGERVWNSIQNGPYQRPMVVDPTNPTVPILEPLSKMIECDKKHYIVDARVMNYLLQAIPNDIYNSVDACKNAKEMWERIKRLMHGSEITTHVRYSRLMDEFDKFAAKEGESLDSMHERLTTLVNVMDLVDYDDEYQGELQGDSQEDNLTTAMMLLSRAISQKFSTPTNNRLCISSNIRNQAVVQDGRVDIQTKNAGYGGNANKNAGRNITQGFNTGNASDESNQIIQRVPRTESTPGKSNVKCYDCNENGHYARECQKPKVHDAKYFREQMLLAMKDKAGSNLSNEENDFMLDTSYGEDLEELTAAVMFVTPRQGGNARRNENGYHHNTMVSI
ncbi:retrovirus-related pol polyprotein from transposon TNT 1-94 [Tanacetum coccineum]|uniref:Retrovirus-related pol polyprotein from transposon TNT 1-94 n=1 Tax=Tanacetum coccineum TaxID=301880 RepID=A0ABQ5H891_9ASTR